MNIIATTSVYILYIVLSASPVEIQFSWAQWFYNFFNFIDADVLLTVYVWSTWHPELGRGYEPMQALHLAQEK